MINSSFTLAHFVWLEGAGETSLDQVGGLTARLIGAPSWSRDAPFEDAGSIILDGASQFITVPGLLANGPREFTVALRYKPDVRLPASSDRRLWSITTSDSPEQTLDVLWRQQDDGGYLWIRGIGKTEREPNKGSEITTDVVAWGSHVPAVAWASVVVAAGVAGLYVYHNGVKVAGRTDFLWPPITPGLAHAFTIGALSSTPTGYFPGAVGEVLVEGRMWTDKEVAQWHRLNRRKIPEHGKWLKNPSNPVLQPTESWEEPALQEPNLLYEDGLYKLWYSGGWDHQRIGYATSADGVTWAKCPINPVLGAGSGGEPGDVVGRGFVLKVEGTYHLYYNDDFHDEKLATSSDGIHWASQGPVIDRAQLGVSLCGNASVWLEGTKWHMLLEAMLNGVWEMWPLCSTDGRTWEPMSTAPLRSMQIAEGGSYGGPMVIKRGERYYCWYHAAPVADTLPTAIYRASSTNLVNWNVYSSIPVVSLTQQWEVDQVADPTIIEADGRCIMMIDQVRNPPNPPRSGLGLIAFDGPLDALLAQDRPLRLPVSLPWLSLLLGSTP
jgi:Concanavalin A-like lectin/glucanases superfamily